VSAVAPTLEVFFTQRLISQKRASRHTIAAYRVPRTCRSEVSTQGGKSCVVRV
jgi:hypothetical protein